MRVVRRFRGRSLAALAVWALTATGIATFIALSVIVDAVLIKEPFPGADRLIVFGRQPRPGEATGRAVHDLHLDDIALAASESSLDVAAVGPRDPLGDTPADPVRVPVSTNFFRVLGVSAMLGRTFDAGDERANDLAVMSERLWRASYAADPGVVGRTIAVGERRLTIVGIVPAAVRFPSDASLWTPLDRTTHIPFTYRAIAQLPASSSVAELSGRLNAWRLTRLREFLYPRDASQVLIFLGAGALLLIVIWGHLALTLAGDAVRRLDEFRLRLALGASLKRVTVEVLAEDYGALLVCVATGTILAPAMLAWLMVRLPPALFAVRSVTFDARATVVVLVVLAVGILIVTAATLPVVRRAPRVAIGASDAGGRAPGRRGGAARWIIALQFAAATPVLYLLGLASQSLDALLHEDLGFQPANVIAVRLPSIADIRMLGAIDKRRSDLRTLIDRVETLPGVKFAAVSSDRLGAPLILSQPSVWLPESGRPAAVRVDRGTVSGSYFQVLEIPVVSGRVFERQAQAMNGPETSDVVIDTALASALGRGEDMIGRRVVVDGIPARVIGIVGATRPRSPDQQPRPRLYVDFSGSPLATNLLIRFSGSVAPVQRAASRAVQEQFALPAPAPSVRLVDELMRLQAGHRGRFELMALAAVICASLAAAGVFGIAAFTVARRRRELAVRLAVGASRWSITWVCLRDVLLAASLGAASGLTGGVLVGREVTALLYLTTPADPRVLARLVAGLLVVGLAGAFLPLHRAWHTDVSAVLRRD